MRTTDSISKSIASRGAARPKDLADAVHAAPPKSVQKAQKKAQKANAVKLFADRHSISVKEAEKLLKKRRKKGKKAPGPAVGPLPTGSVPSSAAAANKSAKPETYADVVREVHGMFRDHVNPAIRENYMRRAG